ncbi:DUF6602 domain-containing protein [Vibrio cholerae]|uniref:DUF6602 domain-containing protein n=1 Tax=Vibrio cholerae TaxID=666 RepID=UPI003966EC67|nr:hypothetical protein [Vibrio cholerae]
MVENYFSGISDILISEVRKINSSFEHQGVKGTGNETCLLSLLRSFLPPRFGVETGIVIDKNGKQAKQSDIVIYEKDKYSNFFSMTKTKFFPIECVIGVIEVKTTLNKKAFNEAMENIESITSLTPTQTRRVAAFIFSYNTNAESLETVVGWSSSKTKGCPYIFLLDHGFIQFSNPKDPIIALCHWEKDDLAFSDSDDLVVHKYKVHKRSWCVVDTGEKYPLSKIANDKYLVDQAKVLAKFLYQVFYCLESAEGGIQKYAYIMRNYMPKEYLRCLSLNNGKLAQYQDQT